MTQITRILVVDDFEPFRNLVGSILQPRAEWEIIAEAGDGLEALEKAEALRPELILLDIALPKLNGMQVAEEIGKTTRESKIIFLSQETSSDIVEEAIRLGASGYVNKAKAVRELISAIDAVLLGKRFFSDGFACSCELQDVPAEQ